MSSYKDTFEADTFEADTFACGVLRGTGVAATVPMATVIRRAPGEGEDESRLRRTAETAEVIRRTSD